MIEPAVSGVPPNRKLHGVFEDHEQAERDQQLVLLRPPVERAQQRGLDHRAHDRDRDGADGQQEQEAGKAERAARRVADRAADDPGRDVGAERIEGAMRQIDDAHDAVDEAQARGDQKQNRRVEERIEQLDDEDRHRSSSRDLRRLRSSHANCGASDFPSLSQLLRRSMRPMVGLIVLPSRKIAVKTV